MRNYESRTPSGLTSWEFLSPKPFQYQWFETRACVIWDPSRENFTKTADNLYLHDWIDVRQPSRGDEPTYDRWLETSIRWKTKLYCPMLKMRIFKIIISFGEKYFWVYLCVTILKVIRLYFKHFRDWFQFKEKFDSLFFTLKSSIYASYNLKLRAAMIDALEIELRSITKTKGLNWL